MPGSATEVAAEVARRISDPDEVARSRQFPFRYLAAHRNAPSPRWGKSLASALDHSLANVPALPGRTLVLVDRSGSMFDLPSADTALNRADSAAIFGTALAVRAEQADLIEFGTDSGRIEFGPDESVLRVLDRFHSLGGTTPPQRSPGTTASTTGWSSSPTSRLGGHPASDPLERRARATFRSTPGTWPATPAATPPPGRTATPSAASATPPSD